MLLDQMAWMSWGRISIPQGIVWSATLRCLWLMPLVVLDDTALGWIFVSIPTDGGWCGHTKWTLSESVHLTSWDNIPFDIQLIHTRGKIWSCCSGTWNMVFRSALPLFVIIMTPSSFWQWTFRYALFIQVIMIRSYHLSLSCWRAPCHRHVPSRRDMMPHDGLWDASGQWMTLKYVSGRHIRTWDWTRSHMTLCAFWSVDLEAIISSICLRHNYQ